MTRPGRRSDAIADTKEEIAMIRRHAAFAAVTGALAATFAFAPAAAAGNVAWNVAIGGPGFGVTVGAPGVGVAVGAPGYWGGRHGYYGGGHGYYGGAYRPWARAIVPAPVAWPAPYYAPSYYAPSFYAQAPVAYPVVVPAPVRYAAPVYGPRRVFVQPHVVRRPVVAVPYGRY